jgi:hypothetical protein
MPPRMPPRSLLNIDLSSSVNTPLEVIFNQESVKFGLWEPWFGLWMVHSKVFVLNIVICFGDMLEPIVQIWWFQNFPHDMRTWGHLFFILFCLSKGFLKWSLGWENFLKEKKSFSYKNIAKFQKYRNNLNLH